MDNQNNFWTNEINWNVGKSGQAGNFRKVVQDHGSELSDAPKEIQDRVMAKWAKLCAPEPFPYLLRSFGEPGKLIDPADQLDGVKALETIEESEKIHSIENLSLTDFKPARPETVKQAHPFQRYPQPKVMVMLADGQKRQVSKTHIVAFRDFVPQDPSGKNVSLFVTDEKGRVQSEMIVNIPTSHNRLIPDYDNGGVNTDVVFDHKIILDDGAEVPNCAFIASHSLRAQLAFTIDKEGRIISDPRYLFADTNQLNKLRQVFNIVYYQQTRAERNVQKFEEDQGEVAPN